MSEMNGQAPPPPGGASDEMIRVGISHPVAGMQIDCLVRSSDCRLLQQNLATSIDPRKTVGEFLQQAVSVFVTFGRGDLASAQAELSPLALPPGAQRGGAPRRLPPIG